MTAATRSQGAGMAGERPKGTGWIFLLPILIDLCMYCTIYAHLRSSKITNESIRQIRRLAVSYCMLMNNCRGYIYFVQAEEIPKVKIGFSKENVRERIKALQTGSCEILKLIETIPNANLCVESALHRKFSENRLHNEWFFLSPSIQSFINEKPKFTAFDYNGDWLGFFNSEESARKAKEDRWEKIRHEMMNPETAIKPIPTWFDNCLAA